MFSFWAVLQWLISLPLQLFRWSRAVRLRRGGDGPDKIPTVAQSKLIGNCKFEMRFNININNNINISNINTNNIANTNTSYKTGKNTNISSSNIQSSRGTTANVWVSFVQGFFLFPTKSENGFCLALYFKEVELWKTTLKIENLKNTWCYFDLNTLERKKIQITKIKIKTNINVSSNINININIINNIIINIINNIPSWTRSSQTPGWRQRLDWNPQNCPLKKKMSSPQQIITMCLVKMIEMSTPN